jgi:hypothetical protein
VLIESIAIKPQMTKILMTESLI